MCNETWVFSNPNALKVPLGTVVRDAATGATLRDLTEEGENFVLVGGGEGGLGNAAFATANCRRSREYTEGTPGREREVELELKTIADVGMVSAGSISLLCVCVAWLTMTDS